MPNKGMIDSVLFNAQRKASVKLKKEMSSHNMNIRITSSTKT